MKGDSSRLLRGCLMMASAIVIVAGLKAASAIVVPILLSIFITILVAPTFLRLQQMGIPSGVALLIMVVALIVLAVAGAAVLASSVASFTESIPKYQTSLEKRIGEIETYLAENEIDLGEERILDLFNPKIAFRIAGKVAGALSATLSQTFLILIIVIFMLLEAAILPKKFAALPAITEETTRKFELVIANVRRYVALKTMLSLLTGFLISIALAFLGVDNWLLLGVLAFALNYIPSVGSILASIPGVILALIQYGPGKAGVVVLLYVVVNVAIGNGLEPRMMGKGLGLSPLVIVVTLIFWGWVLGPIGMLLSIPLTMAVKIGLESFEESRLVALLMGTGIPDQKGVS